MKLKIIGVDEVEFKNPDDKPIKLIRLYCAEQLRKGYGFRPLEKAIYCGKKKFDIEFDDVSILLDACVDISWNMSGKVDKVHFE